MRRGTTPTITFTLPFDGSTIDVLCIAFAQNGKVIFEKHLDDVTIENTTITCPLSEEDTLSLKASATLSMQIRCEVAEQVMASDIMRTNVDVILKDGFLNECNV